MRCTSCNWQVSTLWTHRDLAGAKLCGECLLEIMARVYPGIQRLQ